MPWRSTSMTPRLAISPCSRARNFWRVGPVVLPRSERLCDHSGLRGRQEGAELGQIDRVLAVVVVGVAGDPAGAAVGTGRSATAPPGARLDCRPTRHCRDDEASRGPSRWCRSSCLAVYCRLAGSTSSGSSSLPPYRPRPAPPVVRLVRQLRGSLAHVQLASHHVAIRRVRYSRRRSISRSVRAIATSIAESLLAIPIDMSCCS